MLNNGTFRVTLSLRREPDGGPVFCKMETNQRFKQLKTVKLHTNTTYRIDVSFKPPRALQRLRKRSEEGIFNMRWIRHCENSGDSHPWTSWPRAVSKLVPKKTQPPHLEGWDDPDQAGYPGSSKTAHHTNGKAQAHRPRTPGGQTRKPKPHHSANAITRRLLNTLPHIIQPIGGPPPQDKLATWAWEPSPVYYIYNESGLTETYQLTGPPRALVGNRCKHQSLMIAGQEMEPSERFRDSTACAYSSYYNTDGLNHSKKGQREDLAIVMKGHTERNGMYATYALCSMFAMLAIFATPSGNTGSYDLYETHQLVSSKLFVVGLLWESDDSDDEVQETGELSTCLQVKLYKQRDTQHCEWGSQLHCVELDCCALEGDVSVRVNKETFK
uniref:CB1 cannabinoid receptor-interacting protein 1 n=1 Tax=Timema shepardi TaxID=629360 RepID=A0A7R9AMA2_TIMSH|nr:unnamed protein product [Timema shepardi]